MRLSRIVWAVFMVCVFATAAHASSAFNVSPTRILLTPTESSVVVTLRNDSDHTIRFQLTAEPWSHDDEGRMLLGGKTTDIVIYPPLVSVAAKESKRIRVGAQVAARATESTYRLFVEELPDEGRAPSTLRAIQVRTRIGIPIFLQMPKAKAAPQVESFSVQDGGIEFAIRNGGTAHTVIQTLKLRGVGANGREVFENTAQAGYLLAQKREVFSLVFDPAQCAQTKLLILQAVTEDGSPTRTIEVPPSACTAKAQKK